MRMELYEVVMERAERFVMAHIIAPHIDRAAELVWDHALAQGQTDMSFVIERVDETLPPEMQTGLEAMLESAPVAFASFCEGVGWIAHVASMPQLRIYRIEEVSGDEFYVISPSSDVAAAIFVDYYPPIESEPRMFRVHYGLAGIPNENLMNLPALLEAGPVGFVEFVPEDGWRHS